MPSHNTPHLDPMQINLASTQGIELNATGSKMRFPLRNAIIVPNNVQMYVSLSSFRYQNIFYNIGAHNNRFYYSISSEIGTTEFVEVLVGNYTIDNLLATLTDLLVDHSFAFTYSELTFRVTVTNAVFGFIIRGGENSIASYLGIETDTTQDIEHTGAGCYNLGGISIIDISLPNLNLSSNGSTQSSVISIIDRVQNDVLIGDTKSHVNQSNDKFRANTSVVSYLDIELYGNEGIDLNFLRTPWYLSLRCVFAYKFDFVAPFENRFTEPLPNTETDNNDTA